MKRFNNKLNEHMNDCNCLKKLKKKDFDTYISEKPMYGESDKIKFRYAASGKKTNRKLVPQLVTAGMILAAFVLLIQTTMDPTSSSPDPAVPADQDQEEDQDGVDPKELISDIKDLSFDPSAPQYNERMSIEELEGIESEFNKKINILNKVRDQLDRDLFAKLKMELVENKHSLTTLISKKKYEAFEWKVYESEEELDQHFYDIVPGLKRADGLGFVEEINQTFDLGSEEHDLQIEKIWYNSDGFYIFYSFKINEIPEKKLVSSFRLIHNDDSLREKWMGREDVIYDGRVYNAVKYEPLEKYIPKIEEVNGLYEFDIDLSFGNENFILEDKTIPLIYYGAEQEQYSFNVPINKSISQEGLNFEIDYLKHQLGVNQLHINHEGIRLHGLSTEINGEETYETKDEPDSDTFDYPVRASNQLPATIDVAFKELSFLSDEQLTFEVDTSQVEYGEVREVDIFLGEIKGTEFYISQLQYHTKGFHVTVRSETKDDGITFSMPAPPHMPRYGDYFRSYNQLKLVKENGEEVNYSELSTGMGNNTFSFTVPGGGQKISVALSNLMFRVKLDEEITVDIAN